MHLQIEANKPIQPVNLSTFFKSKFGYQLSFIVGGILPTGLTFNTITGVLSGTPTIAGVFDKITLEVFDTNQRSVLSNTFSVDVYTTTVSSITIVAENNVFQKAVTFGIGTKNFGS